MFNLEKYNISIERDSEMCNKEGEQTDLPYPRWYDDKFVTPFASIEVNKSQLKVCTPICASVSECYDKLEEITNVLLNELYNKDIILWPFYTPCSLGVDKVASALYLDFSFNKEYFNGSKILKELLSDDVKSAYNVLCNNVAKRVGLIRNIVGNILVSCTEKGIRICVNNIDYRYKCGVQESYVGFLVAFIFSCVINSEEDISNDALTNCLGFVNKANDMFSLDLKEYIDKVSDEVINNSSMVDASKKIIKDADFRGKMLECGKRYSEEGHISRYRLKKYPKLASEAVVLVKDAILAGVDYNMLNPEKHMVEFIGLDGKREVVVEGNKTNRDSYIFPFITDDKFYAKRVLRENGLHTPNGFLLGNDMSEVVIDEIVNKFEGKPVVIKPRNTNFGIGITVYPDGTSKNHIKDAIKYAFEFDSNAILEEYALGMEYRFLVINDRCLSVAYRRSASVVGDGKSTIKELIDLKNKEPWHALTATPVKMDEPVVEFLRLQNLTLDSIPKRDERVTLRKNSNCSTGGESVVLTEKIPQRFKNVAECAAKAFNAKICGIDIIINDLKGEDYNIIEVNDMPGYSINEWPYEGNGERIGIEILKLLNLIK